MFAFARRKYAEIEYGYPSVVTPGVFKARSIPCSFTTSPMISGRSTPGGSPARNDFITSSLSAIWRTCFGETKLTASMCLIPAAARRTRYSTFVLVGMISGRPCHASRGHSTSFTISDKWSPLELRVHSRQLRVKRQNLLPGRSLRHCHEAFPTLSRRLLSIFAISSASARAGFVVTAVKYPKSRLTINKYSVSAREPSAMFVGTERTARRSWEVSPYLSSGGKLFVRR